MRIDYPLFLTMIYSYEAKDGGGRTVTGSLDAQDERTAARQVREMGYFLMRLVPTAPQRPRTAERRLAPRPPASRPRGVGDGGRRRRRERCPGCCTRFCPASACATWPCSTGSSRP